MLGLFSVTPLFYIQFPGTLRVCTGPHSLIPTFETERPFSTILLYGLNIIMLWPAALGKFSHLIKLQD